MKQVCIILMCLCFLEGCDTTVNTSQIVIEREQYQNQIKGFWLGQCIANWTGLITEMDKIGNIGEIKTGAFYTRENWGGPDQASIWSDQPSDISPTIDFVLLPPDSIWGADDDTDIEYIYQHLLDTFQTSLLTGEQIRQGWLRHIRKEEENYLWVSNQKAFDLMSEGVIPPQTSAPDVNPEFDMIDAQLTTEIFGLFAPGRPDVARKMADLPIRTTARENAAWISEFYVSMYALAAIDTGGDMKSRTKWMASEASGILPENSYAYKMHKYVNGLYDQNITWEAARDSIYQRYQVEGKDGYDITDRNLYCNGCFAAGINFAASLVSLYWGEGDIKETIKIGVLCGWDSDNPTATWGGMLGFMLGQDGIETVFGQALSEQFFIHRTRQNFEGDGIDNFANMSEVAASIVDRTIAEYALGEVQKTRWIINLEP